MVLVYNCPDRSKISSGRSGTNATQTHTRGDSENLDQTKRFQLSGPLAGFCVGGLRGCERRSRERLEGSGSIPSGKFMKNQLV